MVKADARRGVAKTDEIFGQEGLTLRSLESLDFPYDSLATELDQAPSLGRLAWPPPQHVHLV